MKNIVKIASCILAVGALTFQSCESIELDLRNNPNALSPDNADPNFLLNGIQEDFIRTVQTMGTRAAEFVRIEYLFGRQYQQTYQPSNFDAQWEDIYTEQLTDTYTLYGLADDRDLPYHKGMGQFMEAYSMVMLVDFFGDVPYAEANLGSENFNPSPESGASIYDKMLSLLDEAIANFNAGGVAPQNDFFYDGDAAAWVRACNTLKLKILINRRTVDAGSIATFNGIINTGNYISSVDEDMDFQWGTNAVQPDVRHPQYAGDYTPTGGGDYRANHLMNYMNNQDDPRIRYFFYRQNADTPGAPGIPGDLETIECSLQSPPPHYFGFPFCSLENGYWGRDHGSDEGIPPDGFLRSLIGVYPAGGKFDDDTFEGQVLGNGGGGAGVTPVLMASTVDFWRAEIAMVQGNTPGAKQFMLDGLAKSVEKVTAFGSVDPTADLSFEPSEADITAHANLIDDDFDADATGGWNVLAQEFYVSLYGNGLDGFNFYRRTGYPDNLQPNLEPNPGSVNRSFFYPANAANANSNITQKPDHLQQVFWDNNPSGPSFPFSN
ncbi:SusD/RagB family nutrient-binding outer membrane lipoprotein [Robiginitalea myxolifaciens]|nr:SusD/RagB family nutrient-binding outer membrane lipoprotein [Robiginitalea myxolifaciens]